MSAVQILAQARALGVVLSNAGGKLGYEAPVGRLTPALRESLSTHKAAILDILESERPSPIRANGLITDTPVVKPVETRAAPVDLDAVRLWLELIGEGNTEVIEELLCRCQSEPAVLKYCLEEARKKTSLLDFANAKPAKVAKVDAGTTEPDTAISTSALDALLNLHAKHLANIGDGSRLARVRLYDWRQSLGMDEYTFYRLVRDLEASGQIIREHGYARPNSNTSVPIPDNEPKE